MTREQLVALIEAGNWEVACASVRHYCLPSEVCETASLLEPINHDVMKKHKRRDKTIDIPTGEKDDEGNDKTTKQSVPVARLSIPIQKKIVMTAAAFLGTPVMQSNPEEGPEQRLVDALNKVWDDNKLDWRFRNIAKKVMSERECAELWYTEKAEDGYWEEDTINSGFKLSVKILARSLGDKMYPVFDDYGSMIAFGHKYTTRDENYKEVEHFDIYTAKKFFFSKLVGSVWWYSQDRITYDTEFKSYDNPIGKIPVIYYSQDCYEWQDVQTLIDRLETKISNHADTNDYFDSPKLLAKGKILNFARKGEAGQVFELENEADMKYLTWDQAPESTKLEIDNLLKFIYQYTCTPDISFENMKSLGAFSGIALKMFFQDALMKANDKREMYGECVQRRINYLKTALGVLDPSVNVTLSIKPAFNDVLPVNEEERINLLGTAVDKNLMTRDTAIRQNPLVENPEEEIDALDKEKKENTPVPQPAVPGTTQAPILEVV